MKKKVMLISIIFVLLLLSIVFANSYVQALSKEEILNQKVTNNEIIDKCNVLCTNTQKEMINCDNNCYQKEACEIYDKSNNCINQDSQCVQRNYNCKTSCSNKQSCTIRMCNR